MCYNSKGSSCVHLTSKPPEFFFSSLNYHKIALLKSRAPTTSKKFYLISGFEKKPFHIPFKLQEKNIFIVKSQIIHMLTTLLNIVVTNMSVVGHFHCIFGQNTQLLLPLHRTHLGIKTFSWLRVITSNLHIFSKIGNFAWLQKISFILFIFYFL